VCVLSLSLARTQSGHAQVIIGTFSACLLVYDETAGGKYELSWSRQFEHPVVSLCVADVDDVRSLRVCVSLLRFALRGTCRSPRVQDGFEELIVATLFGVHVMHIAPALVESLLLEATAAVLPLENITV
jgi:hypothetical protein